MNRELRIVSLFVLVMFLALFGASSLVQVIQQPTLRADPRNARTLYESFSAERGPIVVAGQPVAESRPVDDAYRYQRTYPDKGLYAAATGYFTLNQGTTGIEAALNDYLSGTSSDQFLDRLNALFTGQNPRGAAVELTLDPAVQQAAYDALGNNRGAVVALDPKTGAVLALVSKPGFDPNGLASHNTQAVIDRYHELEENPEKPLQNRALSGDLYHPGSTIKLVLAAAALESGDYTADSEFDNPAELQLPQSSSVIHNSTNGTCGPGTKASILTAVRLSCNIPFAQLGRELGYDAIAAQAAKFGFGDSSLDLPIPVTASVFPPTQSDAELMLASFGQASVRVTPLQIAMVSAAIGNDGVLMRPQLVKSITAPDLSPLQTFQPLEYGRPISADTAHAVTGMMLASVANGAASNATISGVDVAGKTGTAENGEGQPFTLWFTGFAPADDPQVAIAVVVESDSQSGFGNTVAAPIAKRVIEAVLNR